MGCRRVNFCILILAVGIAVSIGADERDDAIGLERQGDFDGAIELYRSWLDDHPRHPSALDVLIHAASLSDSAVGAVNLLDHYAPFLSTGDRYDALHRMAALESTLGLPADAARHYEQSAGIGGAIGERRLLDALTLRYGMGEFESVIRKARPLTEGPPYSTTQAEAIALTALSMARLDRNAESLAYLNAKMEAMDRPPPVLLLARADVARSAGATEVARQTVAVLGAQYPSSMPYYLVLGRVNRWFAPAFLESASAGTHTISPVQTGAFAERLRAADLRHRLENDGFTAWLEESGGIWRVYVNDPDGNVRSRLQSRGYDFSVGG